MAVTQHLAIFADESGISDTTRHFGAIRCSVRRAEILREKIQFFREQHGLDHSMQWKKLSPNYEELYSNFVNIFLDDPYARFQLMAVDTSLPRWQQYLREASPRVRNEEAHFRSYRDFLLRIVPPYTRAFCYLDALTVRWKSRWKSLSYLINQSRRDEYMMASRNIRVLQPVDDPEHEWQDLLQMTDVLLGAFHAEYMDRTSSPARLRLMEHITSTLKQHPNEKKLRIVGWG